MSKKMKIIIILAIVAVVIGVLIYMNKKKKVEIVTTVPSPVRLPQASSGGKGKVSVQQFDKNKTVSTLVEDSSVIA